MSFQMDVRALHRKAAPPLTANRRSSSPPSDAKWAQRQYSMIWAPLDLKTAALSPADARDPAALAVAAIAESAEEAGAPFVAAASGSSKDKGHLPPVPKALGAIGEQGEEADP
mmetsp:Transcript_31870/g.109608  ORF Transcript_31870/g.109608 Transcript_31870/m.109608 type:complete len:113 (+) Transcript_31870:1617-1955(+)